MVQLTRIYTGGGDKGQTSLGNGNRVAKHDTRVAAYGTADETNAAIGIARLHADAEMDAILSRIQNDLFDLGGDLCIPEPGPEDPPLGYEPLRVSASQVAWLEQTIDAWNAKLEPLKSFVLPAGAPASAHLHLARTIARRAEREVTVLMTDTNINLEVLRYLNRLSDLLFVLARCANLSAGGDVLWVPGNNR